MRSMVEGHAAGQHESAGTVFGIYVSGEIIGRPRRGAAKLAPYARHHPHRLPRQRQDDAAQSRAARSDHGQHRGGDQRVRRGRPRSHAGGAERRHHHGVGKRLPVLHRVRRSRHHAQQSLSRPRGERDSALRSRRHRDVGAGRPVAADPGVPVRSDAGRALPHRRRGRDRRCGQWPRHAGQSHRVGAPGGAGRSHPHHQTRSRRCRRA